MTILNKIEISGFKSIKNIKFEPLDINVLIGANGSGKSNFIEAFALLGSLTDGKLRNYVDKAGGAERLLHFGSKNTETITLHACFNESVDQYKIVLEVNQKDRLFVEAESAYFWKKEEYLIPYERKLYSSGREAAISQENQEGVSSFVRDTLKSWRVYHFDDTSQNSPMKKMALVDDNRFLRSDGANLASVLYLLKNNHRSEFKMISSTIRRIAPFFRKFSLKPRSLDKDFIRLEWKHEHSENYFDISSFSDGTLRFIALATLLLQPKKFRPYLILLDEPELGLHPYAISLLGSMIKSASKDTQIIISTQSPLLLDQFEPEHVVVVESRKGRSQFKRLQNKDLEAWLKDYSLGQLWENNEIGGRPS